MAGEEPRLRSMGQVGTGRRGAVPGWKSVGTSDRRASPYGSWSSPITAEVVVAGAAGLGEVVVDGDDVWWAESRPDEGGRTVVVRLSPDGTVVDMVPSGVDVRTGVHEYGGGAWWVAGGVLVHSDRADERLYRRDADGVPVVITPAPGAHGPCGTPTAGPPLTAGGTCASGRRTPPEGNTPNLPTSW